MRDPARLGAAGHPRRSAGAGDALGDARPAGRPAARTASTCWRPTAPSNQLRTVQRDTDNDAQTLLTELISGPNPGEFEAGLRTAIPSTLELHSVRVDDGVVQVDLSDELLDLSGGDLTRAVAQIVFTASEIPGAESVLIRVDGATQEWPDGSGAQHRGPLTTYDFIGYAESAQPAFPVSPAPTTAVPPSTTTTVAPTTTARARPRPPRRPPAPTDDRPLRRPPPPPPRRRRAAAAGPPTTDGRA